MAPLSPHKISGIRTRDTGNSRLPGAAAGCTLHHAGGSPAAAPPARSRFCPLFRPDSTSAATVFPPLRLPSLRRVLAAGLLLVQALVLANGVACVARAASETSPRGSAAGAGATSRHPRGHAFHSATQVAASASAPASTTAPELSVTPSHCDGDGLAGCEPGRTSQCDVQWTCGQPAALERGTSALAGNPPQATTELVLIALQSRSGAPPTPPPRLG